MAGTRTNLDDFALATPLYAGATVTIFTVDPVTFKPTATLATVYADLFSLQTSANPQTLDNSGKWVNPVYVDVPVIMQIGAGAVASFQTGINGAIGTFKADWATGILYFTGDTIRDGTAGTNTSNLYYCAAPHLSGNFATDLAAGKWLIYINASVIAAGVIAAAVAASIAAVAGVPAAAGTLTGTVLAANVVTSSLTSFGAGIALGTPLSGVVTNLTGTAAGVSIGGSAASANTAGTATNVAGNGTVGAATGTFTGAVTAANGTSGTQVVNFGQFSTSLSASADKVALPGGTFWQAGSGTDNGAGVTITFPTAFPAQCTSFVAVIRGAVGPAPVGAVTGTRSATGCAVWAFNTTNGNAFGVEIFDWIAEGH